MIDIAKPRVPNYWRPSSFACVRRNIAQLSAGRGVQRGQLHTGVAMETVVMTTSSGAIGSSGYAPRRLLAPTVHLLVWCTDLYTPTCSSWPHFSTVLGLFASFSNWRNNTPAKPVCLHGVVFNMNTYSICFNILR